MRASKRLSAEQAALIYKERSLAPVQSKFANAVKPEAPAGSVDTPRVLQAKQELDALLSATTEKRRQLVVSTLELLARKKVSPCPTATAVQEEQSGIKNRWGKLGAEGVRKERNAGKRKQGEREKRARELEIESYFNSYGQSSTPVNPLFLSLFPPPLLLAPQPSLLVVSFSSDGMLCSLWLSSDEFGNSGDTTFHRASTYAASGSHGHRG